MPRATSKDSPPPAVSLLPSMSVKAWVVTASPCGAALATAITPASRVPSQDAFGMSCNAASHALAVASLSGWSSFTL